jgi:DNA-binding NtrC family response regulator
MEKILVIDDEKATLSMFRLFLEAYGYLVFTAENGTEGVDIFVREKPAIVITDIKMPGIDGLAVLQRIKDIDPEAGVIVTTGHGDTDLAQQALDRHAVDFIHKPIKKDALDAALKKATTRLRPTENNPKQ